MHFIGTFGSTLSQVIWEERALFGFTPSSTFNAFAQKGSDWRDVGGVYAPMPDAWESLKATRNEILQTM